MDAETKVEIQDSYNRVLERIEIMFKNFSSDMKEWFLIQHNPLLKEVDKHTEDIRDLYEKERSMRDRIAKLESRQSKDEGQKEGATGVHNMEFNKKTILWTAIGIICSAGITVAIFLLGG